jgi:hypothetical protein
MFRSQKVDAYAGDRWTDKGEMCGGLVSVQVWSVFFVTDCVGEGGFEDRGCFCFVGG